MRRRLESGVQGSRGEEMKIRSEETKRGGSYLRKGLEKITGEEERRSRSRSRREEDRWIRENEP